MKDKSEEYITNNVIKENDSKKKKSKSLLTYINKDLKKI